jgi:hypothetical protein
MTDYSKLTVVKLKEELKQRGLPQAGLKAVLIARLEESDAQSKSSSLNELLNPVDTTSQPLDRQVSSRGSEIPTNGTIEPPLDAGNNATNATSERKEEEVKTDPKNAPQEAVAEDTSTRGKDGDPVQSEPEPHSLSFNVEENAGVVEDRPTKVEDEDPVQSEPEPHSQSFNVEESAVQVIGEQADVKHDMEDANPDIQNDTSKLPVLSTQTTLNAEEVLEDSRKRKRRSQSPPPSTFDSAVKKAKALDGSPVVKLPEDVETDRQEVQNEEIVVTLNGDSAEFAEVEPKGEHALVVFEVAAEERSPSVAAKDAMDIDTGGPRRSASVQADIKQSPAKPSPSDTRFKNLFSAPAKPAEPPPREPYADVEDREIAPAIHPATSALYIRNFTRPLHPASLKEHLIALATSPDDAPSSDIITDFFLDSIKTHCLVRFTSVTKASRVRNALHDRVWPDQTTRKPLWIDFVPEDRLKKWIEVEESASKDRRQPIKRWEVVYEQGDDGVQVYLQEADRADGMGPLRNTPSNAPVPQTRLPSDPTPRGPSKPAGDIGKGFKALDDLFKFTAAKPKLYYQPVPEATAKRRLDRLAAGRGGGKSDEMRRFSFEDDTLVDKGPEFGSGFRGRGRAGYAGGYSGRGREGGYRDGGYRDGGFRDGGFRERADMRNPWRGGR